ncbi:periplasmic heavy metal sensor [Phenylobacterium sp.]|uniref:periplasmic heavy metal sensor n=1 Tax=Phenylobacterium sp. TaxID=1871053 RepID=UPI00301E1B23
MNRPWLLGALLASLALNVFIGGAFAGAHLAERRAEARAERDRVASAPRLRGDPLAAAVRALPPESQAAWRAEGPAFVREHAPKAREARRLAREALKGFGAEPFETERTLEALRRARALEQEGRLAMDARMVRFAATLPREQREAFGEALARPRGLGRDPERSRQGPDSIRVQ